LFLSAARSAGRAYDILRTGRIYGACLSMMEHSGYALARKTALEQDIQIRMSPERSSYVSIHDVLTAVQFVLTVCPERKIFNVSGLDSDASDSEIAMMLYRNFPKQCRVTMGCQEKGQCADAGTDADRDKAAGILLNAQLLHRYGFIPSVTLEDGLIILVKSLQNTGDVFIFDNTYMGKLTRVQQILLGYLLEIDRICKKHGIKYFLAGGTLLGAIRHHGFIPWDDDADVMMLREDFDRFMEVVQQELPDNIFVQVPSTEKGNYNPFTKLRINNTMFATEFTSKFLDMHNGVFFDVLSHDQTGNHKWSQKLHLMWTMLSRSIVFNKWGNTNIKSGGNHPLFCKFVDKAKHLVPMPFAQWMQERAFRFFQHRKSDYLYDGMGRNLKRGAFPREWLEEVTYVDFEGYQFPVPKEYDKYLTYLYGDYMQMIPVSQRRTSHSIVLTDLGEYSRYECGKDA
ncbi:MAG: LicD family protein, partial [Muricoprocola sp.]